MQATAEFVSGAVLGIVSVCGMNGQSLPASDVRIHSSQVAPGEPVPQQCREEARVFATILVRYSLPSSWHWVLLCDEAGWQRFLRLTGREQQAAIYASTDLAGRATYLRGSKLLMPYDLGVDPDEVIAHELAHIQSGSRSERTAEGLAQLWRSGARATGQTIGFRRQVPIGH